MIDLAQDESQLYTIHDQQGNFYEFILSFLLFFINRLISIDSYPVIAQCNIIFSSSYSTYIYSFIIRDTLSILFPVTMQTLIKDSFHQMTRFLSLRSLFSHFPNQKQYSQIPNIYQRPTLTLVFFQLLRTIIKEIPLEASFLIACSQKWHILLVICTSYISLNMLRKIAECPCCGVVLKKSTLCQFCGVLYCRECCSQERAVIGRQGLRVTKQQCERCHHKFVELFSNKKSQRQIEVLLRVIEFAKIEFLKAQGLVIERQKNIKIFKAMKEEVERKQNSLKEEIQREQKKCQQAKHKLQIIIERKKQEERKKKENQEMLRIQKEQAELKMQKQGERSRLQSQEGMNEWGEREKLQKNQYLKSKQQPFRQTQITKCSSGLMDSSEFMEYFEEKELYAGSMQGQSTNKSDMSLNSDEDHDDILKDARSQVLQSVALQASSRSTIYNKSFEPTPGGAQKCTCQLM